ncbi:MAG: hypothetical protein QM642_00700 [Edaphocola sp.]
MMVKSVLTAAAMFAAAFQATAQSARETTAKYNKTDAPAVSADYNKNKDVVEDALKTQMAKEGIGKPGSSKGYMLWKGVTWTNVSTEKVDVYAKVEGKKEQATVTILLSKGYDNFANSTSDPNAINKIKDFLNSFTEKLNAYDLGLNIKEQEEIVKKAEKEYNGSVSDGKDLESEKSKIEKKIEDNKKTQADKQKALQTEQAKLDALKAK